MAGTLIDRSKDAGVAVPNKLRELREERDLTRRELALRIGVTESTVERWETAKRGIPDAKKLELAGLLGVTPSELMGWD
jgi:transcriptional regulator with XRE-family HTH domain